MYSVQIFAGILFRLFIVIEPSSVIQAVYLLNMYRLDPNENKNRNG